MSPAKVMIATPSYDSRLAFGFAASLFDTSAQLAKRGIDWTPFMLGGCSLIEIARQDIVAHFMQSDCTHLLMIDSDIGWRGEDVVRMLDADEPLLFAVAPKRLSDDFAVIYKDGEDANTVQPDHRWLIEVDAVGGAFALIRRDAIERLQEAHPELAYKQGGGETKYGLFLMAIDQGMLWGEDYSFCHRWRAIGGKVLVDPQVWLRHSHGSFHVEGYLGTTIQAIRDHNGPHLGQSIWSLPSRGRPESMQRFIDAYRETEATCRVFVWIDSDDPKRPEYEKIEYPAHWIVETGPRFEKRCNGVIEEMFRRFPDASCYGFLADDLLPQTKRWDARLANAARRDRLSYGDDGLQGPNLSTHPCVGGDLARAIGWLVMPGVEQYFVDTALYTIAKGTGRLVYVPEVKMEHLHPIAGKAPNDETYRLGDRELIEREAEVYKRWSETDLPAIAQRVNEFASMRGQTPG